MRQFQKLLSELKGLVSTSRPGESLVAPPLLPRIDLDGVSVAYVHGGLDHADARKLGRPTVLFIHGFGGFFMDWPRVMAPVSKHAAVYAIDLPGWGFSDPNAQAKSMADDAKIIGRFIEKMGLTNVVLCGISYGAGVAWATAATDATNIDHAVLLNPMPPYPLRYMHSALYRAIFVSSAFKRLAILGNRWLSKAQYKIICRENLLNHRLLDTFYLDLAYMVMKQPKMPFILNAHALGARRVDWADWENRLGGIRIPVSILQGTDDRIFSMESAVYLHRLIPTSEVIEIAECGHAMVFDQHKKVSEFLIRLIASRTAVNSDGNSNGNSNDAANDNSAA